MTFKDKKWMEWDAQEVREWLESHESLYIKEHAVKFQRQNIFGSYLFLVNDMTLKAELEIEEPKARREILQAIKNLSGSKKMLESTFGLSSSECVEPQVGDIVAVDVIDNEINGKVKFRGTIDSISPDEVFGVDLGVPEGTCDGTWLGEKYFTCGPGHGIFVRAKEIKHIVQSMNVEGPADFLSSEAAEMPDFDKFDSDFLDSGLSGDFSTARRDFSHRESMDLEEFELSLKNKFGDPLIFESQSQDTSDLDRLRAEHEERL